MAETQERPLAAVKPPLDGDDEAAAADRDERLAREADAQGKSIEKLAEEREENGVAEEEQMTFPGTQSSLTLNAGGAKPSSALAKVSAISLPMPPQSQLTGEDEVLVSMRCRVTFVGFRELKKGGKQREHTLTPIELIEVRPAGA